MKKILSILAALGLVATSSTSVVACKSSKAAEKPFALIFKNSDASPEANSNFRLMGRHRVGYKYGDFNNKFGDDFGTFEVSLGVGLDTSNPIVQSEELNWLYYLLFYNDLKDQDNPSFVPSNNNGADNTKVSSFDGVRTDCSAGIDGDVLKQTGQLMDDLFDRTANDANANDHLSYNEGYSTYQQNVEKQYFNNNALDYDDDYHVRMENNNMWFSGKGKNAPTLNGVEPGIAINLFDDETEDNESNGINPNITYSQNHDNYNDRIIKIAKLQNHNFTYSNFSDAKEKIIADATAKYYDLFDKTDKTYKKQQISPKNQVSLYADMMMNKDTVPMANYADIFEAEKDYMSTPTATAEPIMDIINARSKYVAGGQQRRTVGDGHIMTNVRFGKGYYEGKTFDQTGRDSGMVTVFSNNRDENTNVKVYVGLNHANQKYVNLINTSQTDELGLTVGVAAKSHDGDNSIMSIPNNKKKLSVNNDSLLVDDQGYLTINVKGTNKPFVDGYLSTWVPDNNDANQNVYTSQNEASNMKTYEKTKQIFNSNSALDSHVMYESFATMMPNQGFDTKGQKSDYYEELKKHASDIAKSGITDFWMAPPYISENPNSGTQVGDWAARYGYGYMMTDRYDLGEKTPSKYGTSKQLTDAIKALHEATDTAIKGRNIKIMLDYVPHQIVRGDTPEKVTYDEYSGTGIWGALHLTHQNVTRYLKTKTSESNYQYKYGGKYLEELSKQFPDIFSTPAYSTREKLTTKKITQWSAKYEISYPLEFGIDSSNAEQNQKNNVNNSEFYLYEKQW